MSAAIGRCVIGRAGGAMPAAGAPTDAGDLDDGRTSGDDLGGNSGIPLQRPRSSDEAPCQKQRVIGIMRVILVRGRARRSRAHTGAERAHCKLERSRTDDLDHNARFLTAVQAVPERRECAHPSGRQTARKPIGQLHPTKCRSASESG